MPRAFSAAQPVPRRPASKGDDVSTLAVSVDLPPRVAAILDLVDEIPPGAVRTYGDLAALAGGSARYAGWVLSRYGHLVPWWRVVNAAGMLPPSLRGRAASRWREEGTPVRADGTVDVSRARVPRP